MSSAEVALLIDCEGDKLPAVVTPPLTAGETGVLIVVGGPQVRVGSHRQFVVLARALAGAGHRTMRFDLRGMGDATGSPRGFDARASDIAAAASALRATDSGLRRVVAVGLCDAASALLLALAQDVRLHLDGLVLMNPWVRSESTIAATRVRHYYLDRLKQRDFWVKAARGAIGWEALRELLNNTRVARRGGNGTAEASFQERMIVAWQGYTRPVLLMLSGNDYTAKEFLELAQRDGRWQQCINRESTMRVDFADADHTFSGPAEQGAIQQTTLDWMRRHFRSDPKD